jgi:hypothetical protein
VGKVTVNFHGIVKGKEVGGGFIWPGRKTAGNTYSYAKWNSALTGKTVDNTGGRRR